MGWVILYLCMLLLIIHCFCSHERATRSPYLVTIDRLECIATIPYMITFIYYIILFVYKKCFVSFKMDRFDQVSRLRCVILLR